MVALPSCKAEYVAATSAAAQGLWLARLLGELHGRETEAVGLIGDSKSALALAKNPVFHKCSYKEGVKPSQLHPSHTRN